MIARVSSFFHQHPMLKGMAVYAVIWPTSSTIQQIMNKEKLDPMKSSILPLRHFLRGADTFRMDQAHDSDVADDEHQSWNPESCRRAV